MSTQSDLIAITDRLFDAAYVLRKYLYERDIGPDNLLSPGLAMLLRERVAATADILVEVDRIIASCQEKEPRP